LDGTRGIAILLVMVFHFAMIQPTVLADRIFWNISQTGWAGVDLFFVLSGFLITGILYDAKGSDRFFLNFYMRRALRIFPLYYAFLAIFFFVLPSLHTVNAQSVALLRDNQVWYWTYLTNVLVTVRSAGWSATPLATSHFWSLAVEEQFYLVWPALVYLLSRQRMAALCVALIVAALAIRLGLRLAGGSWYAAYVLTPARMDALAVGGLLALLARGNSGLAQYRRWCMPVVATALFAMGIIWLSMGSLWTGVIAVHTVGFTVLAILFGAMLLWTITSSPDNWLPRFLNAPLLRSFGRYSYAMYIFHLPVKAFVLQQILSVDSVPRAFGSQLPGQLLLMVVGIATSYALAIMSWHLFEKHFLRLKDHFRDGKPPTQVGLTT
jgi:peptidoglycan/LPS O-acetylase OafA/YrhL